MKTFAAMEYQYCYQTGEMKLTHTCCSAGRHRVVGGSCSHMLSMRAFIELGRTSTHSTYHTHS
jgi:hypothetical protein